MNLEDIKQRDKPVEAHTGGQMLYDPTHGKYGKQSNIAETGRRMAVAKGWGEQREAFVSDGHRISFVRSQRLVAHHVNALNATELSTEKQKVVDLMCFSHN